MTDGDRRPLRADRRRLDLLRDGDGRRDGDAPRRHADVGRPRPPRARRRARPTTSSAARSSSCSRASRRTRSSRPFDLPVIGRYFPDYEADDHPPAVAGRAPRRNASRPRSTISSLAVSETRNQPGFSTIVPGQHERAELGEAVREREVVRVGRADHQVERALGPGRPRSPSRAAPAPSGRGAPGARRCRSTASRGRGSRAGAARSGSPSRRPAGGRRSGSRPVCLSGNDGWRATNPIRCPGASVVLP